MLTSEVIKDDEVISLDMIDDLKKTSVKFGERYPLDELVHGKVFHSVSYEVCLPSDSTCQEGLSASCLAVNE